MAAQGRFYMTEHVVMHLMCIGVCIIIISGHETRAVLIEKDSICTGFATMLDVCFYHN